MHGNTHQMSGDLHGYFVVRYEYELYPIRHI